ncbi:DUF6379 domain-containing protein [Amnibacterium flavum]|uniref:C-deglycosylation enzyme beta subunit n=1 Tax=Amnibacterium flavum TaxID=2173173 RepID=A0A2V1HT12_9MICO|nr:DUF6379 domain-containing protein [Amnibacterium flavum]PVZ95746.1 hypothetical protein DDQ50_04505 [Amnibacterium flavum]
MTRPELLLGPDAAVAGPGGLEVRIRQPWYRSLPLTSVLGVTVAIDGEDVPADAIRLRVNGRSRTFDELAEVWDEVWFIQDEGAVEIAGVERAAGDDVDVSVEIELRFPYIIIDGVGPLTRRTDARRTLSVQENRP